MLMQIGPRISMFFLDSDDNEGSRDNGCSRTLLKSTDDLDIRVFREMFDSSFDETDQIPPVSGVELIP